MRASMLKSVLTCHISTNHRDVIALLCLHNNALPPIVPMGRRPPCISVAATTPSAATRPSRQCLSIWRAPSPTYRTRRQTSSCSPTTTDSESTVSLFWRLVCRLLSARLQCLHASRVTHTHTTGNSNSFSGKVSALA